MERLTITTKYAAADDGTIEALAWPFDTPDRVGDVIEKGAFGDVTMPLPMLFAHDQKDPVGVWEKATIAEDGLRLTGRLLIDAVQRAREVAALVKAGAIRGISIGFMSKKFAPRRGGGRIISALDLVEASLVAGPMHPGARITSAKSALTAIALAEAINRASAQFLKG